MQLRLTSNPTQQEKQLSHRSSSMLFSQTFLAQLKQLVLKYQIITTKIEKVLSEKKRLISSKEIEKIEAEKQMFSALITTIG